MRSHPREMCTEIKISECFSRESYPPCDSQWKMACKIWRIRLVTGVCLHSETEPAASRFIRLNADVCLGKRDIN